VLALEHDPFHRYVLLAQPTTSEVVIVRLNVIVFNRFQLKGITNISVDPRDGTMWTLGGYPVQHLSAQGTQYELFNVGFNVSGMAFNATLETLFLMRSEDPASPRDDQLFG
jgi:hypothetical protein